MVFNCLCSRSKQQNGHVYVGFGPGSGLLAKTASSMGLITAVGHENNKISRPLIAKAVQQAEGGAQVLLDLGANPMPRSDLKASVPVTWVLFHLPLGKLATSSLTPMDAVHRLSAYSSAYEKATGPTPLGKVSHQALQHEMMNIARLMNRGIQPLGAESQLAVSKLVGPTGLVGDAPTFVRPSVSCDIVVNCLYPKAAVMSMLQRSQLSKAIIPIRLGGKMTKRVGRTAVRRQNAKTLGASSFATNFIGVAEVDLCGCQKDVPMDVPDIDLSQYSSLDFSGTFGQLPDLHGMASGTVLDNGIGTQYLLSDNLGCGIKACVFKAIQADNGEIWSAKVQEEADMTRCELGILAALQHPSVVLLKEVFYAEGLICMIMEYCGGGSVWSSVRSRKSVGVFPATTIVDMMLQTAEGLAFIHQSMFVHLDFKSENVLISNDGQMRISDFGTTVPLPSGTGYLLPGPPIVSPPEAGDGGKDIQAAVITFKYDNWGLGCILAELLTLMLIGTDICNLAHSDEEHAWVLAQGAAVHGGMFSPLLQGLLEKDPDTRLSSADALAMLRKL